MTSIHTPDRISAEDRKLIDAHIASKGVTICPPNMRTIPFDHVDSWETIRNRKVSAHKRQLLFRTPTSKTLIDPAFDS